MSKISLRGRGAFRFWPRSLRWRLQLWQGFLVLSMMTGFGVTAYQLQRISRFGRIDSELETRVRALSRSVREAYRVEMEHRGPPDEFDATGGRRLPPDHKRGGEGHRPPLDAWRPGDRFGAKPDHGPPPDERVPAAIPLSPETTGLFGPAQGGYYFTIWHRDGTVLNRSGNAPADSPWPPSAERDTLPHFRTRGQFREAVHCSGFGDCSMAGRSIESDLTAMRAFGWTLFGTGAGVLGLGFGLGWWLIGRAIRPVEAIGQAATHFAGGNLSERIQAGDRDDELGRLAAILNSTFGRLESAFVRQQQFTSDAAHELRTPLAILISEAQTTLARERTAAEYRETVEGSLETAQQMRRITETLLELARFDAVDPAMPRGSVDLAQVAARCVERLRPLTEPQNIAVLVEFKPAAAFLIEERLEVVTVNLLTNAIYYNRRGGEVRVATYIENGSAVLQVSDTGIGIPAEDIPHIFDRFYRADKSRSRSQGHAGLGLAICKTIVEAEHGSIEVSSVPEKGTTFTVRFPQ